MASNGDTSSNEWQNRIVRYGVQAADQFTANPRNPRRHPQAQRDAVKGSLDTLGFIAPVLVNKNSGYLIDGHERVMQALGQGDETPVPFIEVDLTEDEEALALASFDWITYMATYDKDTLSDLLRDIDTDNADLQALLDSLAAQNGLIDPIDPRDEWVGMPEFESEPLACQSIYIHFKKPEDVKAFAELIGQNLTDKTRSMWYPYQEKQDRQSLGYISNES